MTRANYFLKVEREDYKAMERGDKMFLLLRDSAFEKGDWVRIEETVDGLYTGNQLRAMKITHILYGPNPGLEEGYVVLQLKYF